MTPSDIFARQLPAIPDSRLAGDDPSAVSVAFDVGETLYLPLTQQELVDLVGASRPALSVELNAMRRRGWLCYTRRFICLDQLEAMLDRIRSGTSVVSDLTDSDIHRRQSPLLSLWQLGMTDEMACFDRFRAQYPDLGVWAIFVTLAINYFWFGGVQFTAC